MPEINSLHSVWCKILWNSQYLLIGQSHVRKCDIKSLARDHKSPKKITERQHVVKRRRTLAEVTCYGRLMRLSASAFDLRPIAEGLPQAEIALISVVAWFWRECRRMSVSMPKSLHASCEVAHVFFRREKIQPSERRIKLVIPSAQLDEKWYMHKIPLNLKHTTYEMREMRVLLSLMQSQLLWDGGNLVANCLVISY